MIKEQVLQGLRELGLEPEQLDELYYGFEYNDVRFIYYVDEEKDKCLTLISPNIFTVDEDNYPLVVQAMLALCETKRYVQPQIVMENQVWITYLHYLGDNKVTTDLLNHMLQVLDDSSMTFLNIIIPTQDLNHDFNEN